MQGRALNLSPVEERCKVSFFFFFLSTHQISFLTLKCTICSVVADDEHTHLQSLKI